MQNTKIDILKLLYIFLVLIMEREFVCPGCGKEIGQMTVRQHINTCDKYDPFYLYKIRKLDSSEDPGYIKFLSEQLQLARDYLQGLLQKQKYQKQTNDISINNISNDNHKIVFLAESMGMGQEIFESISKVNRMSMQEDIIAFDQRDMVECLSCHKKFYSSFDIQRLMYVQECWHLFCKPCLMRHVDKQFVNSGGFPKCPLIKCNNVIPDDQLKRMLGDKYQDMQMKAMRKMYNIVQCVKCKAQYDFVPGNPNDAPKKDDNGKILRPQDSVMYAQNRFVCPRGDCKTQQCKQCQATPFHIGMSCKQFKSRALMMKCRYCDTPITEDNSSKLNTQALSDICSAKQCKQLAAGACTKILACGHPCSGIRGEKQCLPCLRQGCCQKNESLAGQTGDDYCAICYIESLTAAPSIQCSCGHVFHMKCIKKRFEIKWLTPRILFNFCVCPLCKKWIQVPKDNELWKQIQQNKDLFAKIQKMALERLKFQECDKDEKLTRKDSPYYNKPSQYAMAIYAYFMCYKCKNPYFGGRKNCAQAMNQQNVQGFNPKQLVCPNCCDIPVENCPKHGKDFIEFKCKFCCSIAQWFCWGNTHFCQPCHKKQCSGDYVSKYTKDKLPKCQGPGKCPIGGDHNGNGQEKMLGCAICRNYKQNSKQF